MTAQGDAALAALPSLWDLILSGGPLMIPIALCSVVALAFAIERALALRAGRLGGATLGEAVLRAAASGDLALARSLCQDRATPLARILATALAPAELAAAQREKRVEDTAKSEVRRLGGNLRPLHVVYLVAPLLGLLGTVWGLIQAFATVALREGLGRPELLAHGVYQALVTTAAGLAVAIPTLVLYLHLRGRIERFARRTEELFDQLDPHLAGAGHAHP